MFIKLPKSKENVIAYTKLNTGNIQYLTDEYLLYSNTNNDLEVCGKLAHEYENISTFYNSKEPQVVYAESDLIDINLFYYLAAGNSTGDTDYGEALEVKKSKLDNLIEQIRNEINIAEIENMISHHLFFKWESTSFGTKIIDLGNNSYYIDDPLYDIFFKKDEQGNNVDIEVINK